MNLVAIPLVVAVRGEDQVGEDAEDRTHDHESVDRLRPQTASRGIVKDPVTITDGHKETEADAEQHADVERET